MALVRVCDMHDLEEWWVVVEATREFEIDGRRYEIDLCGDHVTAFDEAFQPYVDGARKLPHDGWPAGISRRRRRRQ